MSTPIKPFSGTNYHTNQARCGANETPCVICGRPVKDPKTCKWLHVGSGGDCFITAAEAEAKRDDPGNMGCFPIGPECFRKHQKQLQQYV